MAASPHGEPTAGGTSGPDLDDQSKATLLDVAEDAILAGLGGRAPAPPALTAVPPVLREPRGVFVTLLVRGRLNGCRGTVMARDPLVAGVAFSAWDAAFDDPRLPSLQRADYAHLTVEISVLSPLSPINVSSCSELTAALRPRVDGLYILGAGRAGVFLPSVWDELPEPDDFVRHLQLKAGLQPGWWPPDMEAYRFTAIKFGRRAELPQQRFRPPGARVNESLKRRTSKSSKLLYTLMCALGSHTRSPV